jgi:hypothetical protein
MPRSIEELRAVLQHDGYVATRTTHGITFEFDARNNALYEFPLPHGGAGKFQVLAPDTHGLPPRVTAPGLRPQPTVFFAKDPDGQLVEDVDFK